MYNLISEPLWNLYNEVSEQEALLPLKVSDFYMKKIYDEVEHIGTGGPLYSCVLPDARRLMLSSSHESRDYVEDCNNMPVQGADYIIRKYADRVLFLVSDNCFSHCQYCFRNYNLSNIQNAEVQNSLAHKVQVLKLFLSEHSEINEVILSGGDPLSLEYASLSYLLDELSSFDVRIHSRAIVYNPFVFTDKMITLLAQHDVRLVHHIVHPYEVCDTVKDYLNKLHSANVRMYAQFPLLRGINDNWKVLAYLLEIFDRHRIRPLSIFIPDPIKYGASFRVRFNRIIQIIDDLNWNTPSWINSVRVVLDTPYGKVRRENIISVSGQRITFSRCGKQVDYYDLDDGIDAPAEIGTLLWKDNDKYNSLSGS